MHICNILSADLGADNENHKICIRAGSDKLLSLEDEDSKDAVLIDPGDKSSEISSYIK